MCVYTQAIDCLITIACVVLTDTQITWILFCILPWMLGMPKQAHNESSKELVFIFSPLNKHIGFGLGKVELPVRDKSHSGLPLILTQFTIYT